MTVYRRDHLIYLASVFCFWLATYIYVPVFSLYLENIRFSYEAIGIILGSYGVLQVALRFPLGVLADRLLFLRKWLYVSSFAIAIISGLILVFFESFTMVLIGRLLAGMTAAMWVMATIMYAQYVKKENAGRAMGAMQLFTVLPQFASILTAGFLVESLGWLSPFWVGVAASFIGLLLAVSIKVIPASNEENVRYSIGEYVTRTLKTKQLLPISTIALITHGLMFISIFGFTPNYAATLGISEQAIVLLMTAFFLPHAVASLIVTAYHLNPHTERIVILTCMVLAAVMFFLVPFTNSLWTLSATHFLIGLALGFVLPICLSQVARLAPDSLKTSVMGFFQSYYAAGIFLGPWIAGMVAEAFQLHAVFVFASIVAVIGSMITLYLINDQRQRVARD
ncbi:MFS transporter [Geomicrobium sp. JSM 1781026]|uniref:MFS transporter n=1 Tax=Geomicrobium sp. JSM 1781026 TaxID=3344580 RepID=UPI0035BFF765